MKNRFFRISDGIRSVRFFVKRCESSVGHPHAEAKNFFITQSEGKTNVRKQDTHLWRLQKWIHLHSRRAGILRIQGLPERAEALQGLPRCKKERSKTAERVLHHHLRKMRQGSKSSLPADQRQTCLLQRLLRSNEGRTVIKNLQTRIRVFIAWIIHTSVFNRSLICFFPRMSLISVTKRVNRAKTPHATAWGVFLCKLFCRRKIYRHSWTNAGF